ncbi:hypothetical protein [Archangium lipolyticum]|uniref:hypothetical protein n=1 Tax=Archangium lipolyticum TaxID=2970465 RepID=UPI00214C5A24|nr:hypothetical protein [Archangium lipolyticum]
MHDTLEQVDNRRRIPARDVGEQLARQSGQVTPGTEVLDEQHGPALPLEQEPIHEGPFRNGNLAEHAGNDGRVDVAATSVRHQPGRRAQAYRSVVDCLGQAQCRTTGLRENGFEVGHGKRSCCATLETRRQLGESLGSTSVEKSAPPRQRGRKTMCWKLGETFTPGGPDTPEERNELASLVFDESDLVTPPGSSYPRKLGESAKGAHLNASPLE